MAASLLPGKQIVQHGKVSGQDGAMGGTPGQATGSGVNGWRLVMAKQARRREGLSPWAAAAIVAGVLGVSALAGKRNSPDESNPEIDRWYHRLDKPSFTPPDPVFGAVWPVLETLFGYGGYRILRAPSSPERNTAAALWLTNSAMIGGWTELFFGRRKLAASAVAAGAMFAGTAGFVAAASKVDRKAAWTGVPLAAWLAFATATSEEVWRKNPDEGAAE